MQGHTDRQQVCLLVHSHEYLLLKQKICETFNDCVDLHTVEKDVVEAVAHVGQLLDSRLGDLDPVVVSLGVVFQRGIYLEDKSIDVSLKGVL